MLLKVINFFQNNGSTEESFAEVKILEGHWSEIDSDVWPVGESPTGDLLAGEDVIMSVQLCPMRRSSPMIESRGNVMCMGSFIPEELRSYLESPGLYIQFRSKQ